MPSPRFAIYFVPPAGSQLGAFGAAVMGYNGGQGAEARRLALPGIEAGEAAEMTAEPARYGFHATLKAPFRLRSSRSVGELCAAVDAFAAGNAPVSVGQMRVQAMGAFVALKPSGACPAVDEMAANCVRTFDEFRAPLTAQERERRLQGSLNARQIELLDSWGYPYVLDQFRFHMTLAGPLSEARREAWQRALADAFAALKDEPVIVDSIALVQQDDPAGRFRVVHRARLAG